MGVILGIIGFFKAGGLFMFPIMLILAIGTAIIIERYKFIKKSWTDGSALWRRIEESIKANRLEDAIKECSLSEAALPKVLSAGLEKAKSVKLKRESREELENHLEEAMLEVMPELERRTHYLPTLANVSTLLGLLGTIIGLIQSFQSLAVADPSQKAFLLAQGVSVAMNTTAFAPSGASPSSSPTLTPTAYTTCTTSTLDAYSIKLVNLLTSE